MAAALKPAFLPWLPLIAHTKLSLETVTRTHGTILLVGMKTRCLLYRALCTDLFNSLGGTQTSVRAISMISCIPCMRLFPEQQYPLLETVNGLESALFNCAEMLLS